MSNQERKQLHIRVLLGLTLAVSLALFFMPNIPQPKEYHQFSDARTFLYIPNFLDVISNLFLLAASIFGLKLLFDPREGGERARFENRSEEVPYVFFFVGAGLACFGSIYYHWSPNNFSLAWDRIPIAIMAVSFLTIVINERVSQKAGFFLLPVLLLLAIFSVSLWYLTELSGNGDLRLYLMVQFLPMILVLYMLFFMPSRYSRGNRFAWMLGIYALAKAAEMFDQEIFDALIWVSGHTIKHILAALAIFALAEMLRCRIPVNRVQKAVSELDDY